MQLNLSNEALKETFKSALIEVLHEEHDALRDVLAEAIEDLAFAEAIREGQATERISREAVIDALGRKG